MTKKELLIINDYHDDTTEYTLQLATYLRGLTKKQNMLLAVLDVNNDINREIEVFSAYGVDTVIHSDLPYVDDRVFADLVEDVIADRCPQLIVFPSTPACKATASIISTRTESGLTAECVDIVCDEKGDFHFIRAAMSGSALADILCVNSKYRLCTMKKDLINAKETERKECSVEKYEFIYRSDSNTANIELLNSEPIENRINIDLNNYQIIFGIGRGAATEENIGLLKKLTEKYNACIAGTRPVVEDGFLSSEYQIGQSGKSVSPNIYIALGISGANQHIVGIKNAQMIIAVNTDSNAPIMDYADYKVIEDATTFLNAMLNS